MRSATSPRSSTRTRSRPTRRGRSFLDRVLAESAASAATVGRSLQTQVFAAVPLIARGLLGDGEPAHEAIASAFDNSLVLLYRLLFCLHAEARGLLPVDNPHYLEYSLRRQRDRLSADLDRGRVFASASRAARPPTRSTAWAGASTRPPPRSVPSATNS